MKGKKMLAFLLCGTVTLGLLAGCSAKEEKKADKGDKKETKGGYVEEEMEGPWTEEESYLGSFLNEEKKLEIYTQAVEGTEQKVYSYVHQGGSDWEKQEEAWAEEKLADGTYPVYLLQGEDKNVYLMTSGEADEAEAAASAEGELMLPPQPWYLYRHTGEGETQEVPVECLDMEYQKQSGGFFPYYLGVTQNGDIALVGAGSSNIVLYDGKTGKEKDTFSSHEIVTNDDGMISIQGNTILTLGQDQKTLFSYDAVSGKEISKVKIESMELGMGCLAACEDGTYYLATEKGISVYKEKGSIGEQIYDGSRGNMGETVNSLVMKNFLAGENRDFYGMYVNYQTGVFSVCHYYYNAAVSTKTEKTLSVYGLYESRMTQAVVRAFEKKHPEVDVDYQYAMKQEEEGNPEDYLDALNTSLLNQKGPDVLLLDDLPVDS